MLFTIYGCNSVVLPQTSETQVEEALQKEEPLATDVITDEQPALTVAPVLTPAPTFTVLPNPTPGPTLTVMPEPSIIPMGPDDAEKFLGAYSGYYNNNSGKMTLTIDVYMVDMTKQTSNIWARFEFSPGVGNTSGKSGEYKMEGDLNFFTGMVTLHGTQWISSNPENYNMLGLTGTMTETTFNGLLDRTYLPEFYLSRF